MLHKLTETLDYFSRRFYLTEAYHIPSGLTYAVEEIAQDVNRCLNLLRESLKYAIIDNDEDNYANILKEYKDNIFTKYSICSIEDLEDISKQFPEKELPNSIFTHTFDEKKYHPIYIHFELPDSLDEVLNIKPSVLTKQYYIEHRPLLKDNEFMTSEEFKNKYKNDSVIIHISFDVILLGMSEMLFFRINEREVTAALSHELQHATDMFIRRYHNSLDEKRNTLIQDYETNNIFKLSSQRYIDVYRMLYYCSPEEQHAYDVQLHTFMENITTPEALDVYTNGKEHGYIPGDSPKDNFHNLWFSILSNYRVINDQVKSLNYNWMEEADIRYIQTLGVMKTNEIANMHHLRDFYRAYFKYGTFIEEQNSNQCVTIHICGYYLKKHDLLHTSELKSNDKALFAKFLSKDCIETHIWNSNNLDYTDSEFEYLEYIFHTIENNFHTYERRIFNRILPYTTKIFSNEDAEVKRAYKDLDISHLMYETFEQFYRRT